MSRRRQHPQGDARQAVAYLRISTDAERQANGLQVQRQAIESWALAAGVAVVSWHQDERSGTLPLAEREGLGEALAAVQQHGAGLLVVHRLDRFARDTAEGLAIEEQIRRLGARLASTDEGDRPPSDDPGATFHRQIRLAVAQYEAAITRLRIQATKKLQRSQGRYLGGAPPYGWRVNEAGQLERDEGEQAQIEKLRKMRSRASSWRHCALLAERAGLRNRKGSPFDHKSIALVLSRTAG